MRIFNQSILNKIWDELSTKNGEDVKSAIYAELGNATVFIVPTNNENDQQLTIVYPRPLTGEESQFSIGKSFHFHRQSSGHALGPWRLIANPDQRKILQTFQSLHKKTA